MKKFNLFLLAVVLFSFCSNLFAADLPYSDLGIPPRIKYPVAQANYITVSAVQSYGITDKSSELELQIFLDNPGYQFTSTTFTVTNRQGVFFYGASTFDSAYHWTYLGDSSKYRNDPNDFYKIRKAFRFATDGRPVGPDSGFILKLHFKIDQPSLIPAGDTLDFWLNDILVLDVNGSKINVSPLSVQVRVPFGKKKEDPKPKEDSVSFALSSLVQVKTNSDEAIIRLYVLNPDLEINKFEYTIAMPTEFTAGEVEFGSEPDGYAYGGKIEINDPTRNSYWGLIWSPEESLFLRNSSNCYVDIHCKLQQPAGYQAGDTAWFTFFAMYGWYSTMDTAVQYPVKGLDPKMYNLAINFPVVFAEADIPNPNNDTVSFTIRQITPVYTDSQELTVKVDMDNPYSVEMNKFYFMLYMDPMFEPIDFKITSGDILNYSFEYNDTLNGNDYYYFDSYTLGDDLMMDEHVSFEIKIKIKDHNLQPGDIEVLTMCIVGALKMNKDTLIYYPLSGYNDQYGFKYDLPIVFLKSNQQPPNTGAIDLFFEEWNGDDSDHFRYGGNQLDLVLNRKDTTNLLTEMTFDISITSKYAEMDLFTIDVFSPAAYTRVYDDGSGNGFIDVSISLDRDTANNFLAKATMNSTGVLPNQPGRDYEGLFEFFIQYAGIFSEEMTMKLDNITASNNAGMSQKQEDIMSILSIDKTEEITINFVDPLKKILARTHPHDVDGDGDFDQADVDMAKEMLDGNFFGNLKSRLAADAVWPYNLQIDMNDYLRLQELLWSTDIGENQSSDFVGLKNYPNPAKDYTIVYFNLPISGEISLDLYDLLGNKIKTLTQGYYQSGESQVNLNCSDLTSGTYLYKLQVRELTKVQRLVVK